MAKSKNQIANDLYGEDFEDLNAGQKSTVSKKYNSQGRKVSAPVEQPTAVANTGMVKATIGRVAVNGTKTCLMREGATVQDLITQSGIGFDSKKEGVMLERTGAVVLLTAPVVNGETYAIAVGISSA